MTVPITYVVTGSTASSGEQTLHNTPLEMIAYGTWNGGSVTLQRKIGSNTWVNVTDSAGSAATLSADGVLGLLYLSNSAFLRIQPSGVTSVTVEIKEVGA